MLKFLLFSAIMKTKKGRCIMNFLEKLLTLLDSKMTRPESYGWFHLLVWALVIALATLLCISYKKKCAPDPEKLVFITSLVVIFLEVYKQINYTFSVGDGGITADFQWYAFPWQFCSMPMYVGALTGVFKKGKIHESLLAFLATFSVFAGLCVLFYPNDIFVETIGINIQTSICHGVMPVLGFYLFYTGRVKAEHKTILKAIPVFATAVFIAVIINEAAYRTGLLETDTFNMFFVSPHCEPSLPVYSLVQAVVPFPWCLIIYIAAFSLAAYVILLIAIALKSIFKTKSPLPVITYKEKETVEQK